MLCSAQFLAGWLTVGGKSSFSRLLCTGGESRGWELSQQRITGTWFPCWGSPVRLRGRKQQQGRGSQPKAHLRAADLEHILQWRKKCGKGSVQVILQLLHEFYSAQRVPGLRKPPVTLTICAFACPELLRTVQKAGIWQKEAVSSGDWAGFHCPEWSVIPFLTNALKSLCLRDQRIDNFAIEVLRGHSPTVVWSKPEASQLTLLLSWPWKQCGLAVLILAHMYEFGSDLGVMIRNES